MSLLDQRLIAPEFVKLRWLEPYSSSGFNRSQFRTMPRGVHNGFVVKAGPGLREVTVAHDDPRGWGSTSGYAYGAFDTASGWSVAVHSSVQGFNTTVAIQYAAGRNFTFDVDAYGGRSVFLALDVQYLQGVDTAAQVKLVEADDLEADPALIVLGRVDVPLSGAVVDGNVFYDDAAYPRVLPYADQYKPGFMSQRQALDLGALQAVSGSPSLVYETEIAFDGPQDIALPPGYFYVLGGEDLQVWKNGVMKTPGALRDYVEVERDELDGRGEKITWVGLDLRAGDRVKLRIQKYAAHLTSTLRVYDENTLIDANVIFMKFAGTGVQVIPDGPRQVRVVVGGGGGGGGSTVRTKANVTGATIAAFRAVRMLGDNTMALYDPAVSGHAFYGLTLQNVVPGAYGDVQVDGIVVGAAAGVSGGGAIMDYCYVLPGGSGMLTTTPPDPLLYQVQRVGFLDGGDAVSGGGAVDLVFDRGRAS